MKQKKLILVKLIGIGNDESKRINNDDKDENYNKNKNFNITYFPTDDLELNLTRNYSNMDTKYANSLTLEQYKNNPNQAPADIYGNTFNEQYLKTKRERMDHLYQKDDF